MKHKPHYKLAGTVIAAIICLVIVTILFSCRPPEEPPSNEEYEQFVIFVGDRAVFSRKGVLAKDVSTPLSVPNGQMRVHVIGREAENKPINVFVEGTNVSVLKQWK